MKSIRIPKKSGNDFSKEDYACIDGTREENILCAVVALFSNSSADITPEDFIYICKKLLSLCVSIKGLKINYDERPELKGSRLAEDIESLKGTKLHLTKRTINKIAAYLSDDDPEFCTAVTNEFATVEA